MTSENSKTSPNNLMLNLTDKINLRNGGAVWHYQNVAPITHGRT